jgi:hypothetical protein
MSDMLDAIPIDIWIFFAVLAVILSVVVSICVCFVMWLWGHVR